MKKTSFHYERREFIFASLAMGLSSTLSSRALAEILREIYPDQTTLSGSLFAAQLEIQFQHLFAGKTNPEQFLKEMEKRYRELAVKNYFLEDIKLKKQKDTLSVYKSKDKQGHKIKIQLYYIPPGEAHPPHAHTDQIS